MIVSTVVLALVMIALGYLRNLPLLCLIAAIGGIAWIMLVSCFNVATQEASPTWVRARALGAYLVVYQGGTAIGSLLWGTLAASLGDPLAILLAALGAVLGLAAGLRWHLADSEKQDLRPWHVTVPRLLIEPRLQEDPVMVQTEYCIDPQRAEDFLRAMHEVRLMRERDGAFGWFIARDPERKERHVEAFMAESWLDYLRQLDRMTNADHATLEHAVSFHLAVRPLPSLPGSGSTQTGTMPQIEWDRRMAALLHQKSYTQVRCPAAGDRTGVAASRSFGREFSEFLIVHANFIIVALPDAPGPPYMGQNTWSYLG